MGLGMGLSNIISRARSLNGSYEFQTHPAKGFTFKISIPIHQSLE
jgi:signal transduction histidine kinase